MATSARIGRTESHGAPLKRFVCGSIIPDCDRVFTGPGDQSVLDQALEHAAKDHGLTTAPIPFIELVLTHTRPVISTMNRGTLRAVDRDAGTTTVASGAFAGGAAARAAHLAVAPYPPVVRRPCTAADGAAHANVRLLRRPESGRLRPSTAHDTYRHECLLYAGTGGFLDAVVPFVRDGLARREPVLVAVAEPRLTALRSALAGDAGQVMFADMADLGHNPALLIPVWRDFMDRHGGAGRPVRGIGEPIWATRQEEVIVEAQMHEGMLNVAIAPDVPLWLLCPYDTRALAEPVIVEAARSHPVIVEAHTYRGSATYGGAAHVKELFCSPFRQPRVAVTPIMFDAHHHGHVSEILAFAATCGLRIDRAVKLATAVDEVAAAADLHDLPVDIRVWSEQAAMVCEVTDPDTLHDPPVGRVTGPLPSRDRAVRLANEMCDLVQVRSNHAGTATRVRCWL
jgi:predicted small metal-binding protein